MKKFFYKVLSLVLCVTMLFTMGCVSFAHSEIEDEYNYVTEENVIPKDETQVKNCSIGFILLKMQEHQQVLGFLSPVHLQKE